MNHYNWNNDFPSTPERFHTKLCGTLAQLPAKEGKRMNQKSVMKRTLLFAVIAVMVLATTVLAAGKLYSIVSHSNKNDKFTQLPTVAQMEQIINVTPKLVETFDNGFVFTEGVVVHTEDVDENAAVLSRYKTLNFSYQNGSRTIHLTIQKQKPEQSLPQNSTPVVYNGITLYAHDYINKIVPLDYVPTEQDKLDEAAGRLNLATMGGDTIEVEKVQMLMWIDQEVGYLLFSQGDPVLIDELVVMAKQIIDQA